MTEGAAIAEPAGAGHRSPIPHPDAPEPARARRPSVETKTLRFVDYLERLDGPLRHPGRTGPADPDRPAPGHRRGPPPGSAHPGRRDRGGAGPPPRAGPVHPPAAGPARAFPRKRPQGLPPPRPAPEPAGTGSRISPDVKGPAGVPARSLPSLGAPVDRPPAAHDALDVGGRARAPHPEQASFRLRRGHAGEGADLGVGELPEGKGLSEERQRPEGVRHPHPFTSRPQIQPHSPGKPGGAGAEARVPSAADVELADQGEEARGGGVEVCGQLGDFVS